MDTDNSNNTESEVSFADVFKNKDTVFSKIKIPNIYSSSAAENPFLSSGKRKINFKLEKKQIRVSKNNMGEFQQTKKTQ